MKVALIRDYYDRGGAAISALRLSNGLKHVGMDIAEFYVAGTSNEQNAFNYGRLTLSFTGLKILFNLLRMKESSHWIFSRIYIRRIVNKIQEWKPDVVNIHNVHGAFQMPDLFRSIFAIAHPIVWTLHDMWAITGHCGYVYNCVKYRSGGCDTFCPDPESFPPLPAGKIGKSYRKRISIYHQLNNALTIVTPSRWLTREAGNGILRNHTIRTIPYGIDLDVYRPISKKAARDVLSLPHDKKILLLGSYYLNEKRKGWKYFVEAARELDPSKVLLLVFGQDRGLDADQFPVPAKLIGFISDEILLRVVYSAADAFIVPTLADNLPNVLIESIACGTPCVAFNVGGIPDVIDNGKTGFLAHPADSRDLLIKINRLLDLPSDEYRVMSETCREEAVEKYCYKKEGKTYSELFHSLVRSAP